MKITLNRKQANVVEIAANALLLLRAKCFYEAFATIFPQTEEDRLNTIKAFLDKFFDYLETESRGPIYVYEENEWDEKRADFIIQALDVFSRAKGGQFRTLIEATDKKSWKLHWDRVNAVENYLKFFFFPRLQPNCYLGIGSEEIDYDAQFAWDIQKTMQQFVSLTNSDGFFGWTVDFDGAHGVSREPVPVIEGHLELMYKDVEIPKESVDVVASHLEKQDFVEAWAEISKSMTLFDSPQQEIILDDNNFPVCVRCHKPKLKE